MNTEPITISQGINRLTFLLIGLGPEYDILRRIVSCNLFHYSSELCPNCHEYPFISNGRPKSRATFWEDQEENDPGVLAGALANVVMKGGAKLRQSDSRALRALAGEGASLAALRTIIQVLEVL